jgi:hypothetical protein
LKLKNLKIRAHSCNSWAKSAKGETARQELFDRITECTKWDSAHSGIRSKQREISAGAGEGEGGNAAIQVRGLLPAIGQKQPNHGVILFSTQRREGAEAQRAKPEAEERRKDGTLRLEFLTQCVNYLNGANRV